VDGIARAIGADADVERDALLASDLARIDDVEVNVFSLQARKGTAAMTLLEGREPRAPGEVALGASTMRDAGVELGDTLDVESARGTLRATVVGRAAFPVVDERSAVGRGVLATSGDFARIGTDDSTNRDLVVAWTGDVDRAHEIDVLGDRFDAEISAPLLPSDVNNLRDVEAIPRGLAALLAALAALALVHALLSTVRLRRHDLAVLRMLGFERRQLAGAVAWQATTIVAVGTIVGLPLGVALGRLVWRELAIGIGVVDHPVVPLVVGMLFGVLALVLGNLAAALPARRAARVSTASTLRTT
jgi:hypothetical protein